MSVFSERLRLIRGKMSRAEFSKITGISERALVNYEHGVTLPNIEVAAKICLECNVSPQWLLLGEGNMTVSEEAKKIKTATIIHFDPAVQLVVEASKEVGIKLSNKQQDAVVKIVREALQQQTKNILLAMKEA